LTIELNENADYHALCAELETKGDVEFTYGGYVYTYQLCPGGKSRLCINCKPEDLSIPTDPLAPSTRPAVDNTLGEVMWDIELNADCLPTHVSFGGRNVAPEHMVNFIKGMGLDQTLRRIFRVTLDNISSCKFK